MKLLYEAANAIEAHLIKNILEQEQITAFIQGEALQGGIGDLQAFGLVRLMVIEEDYLKARSIVDDWETAEPVS